MTLSIKNDLNIKYNY